jgi:hypothetical protein
MKKVKVYQVTVWEKERVRNVGTFYQEYDVVAENEAEACEIAEAAFTEEEGLPVLKSKAYETGKTFYCK